MYRYLCDACGALFETKAKVEFLACRNNGCQGLAHRVKGVYSHAARRVRY